MTRTNLKQELKEFYKGSMCDSILRGDREIHMKHARTLHLKEIVDITAWIDIKSFLKGEEGIEAPLTEKAS